MSRNSHANAGEFQLKKCAWILLQTRRATRRPNDVASNDHTAKGDKVRMAGCYSCPLLGGSVIAPLAREFPSIIKVPDDRAYSGHDQGRFHDEVSKRDKDSGCSRNGDGGLVATTRARPHDRPRAR